MNVNNILFIKKNNELSYYYFIFTLPLHVRLIILIKNIINNDN